MSLQVWLPLNGDFNNQGLNGQAKVTNYNVEINNSGKIGKCGSFNGTNAYLQFSGLNMDSWANFTITFWCYTTASLAGIFLIRQSQQHQFNISATGISFRDTKHSSSLVSLQFDQPELEKWTHCAIVYKNGSFYVYHNGIKIFEQIYANSAILNTGLNEIRIGRAQSTSGNTYYNGKINDFRIYDHALSAQQIEKLAQGLVLHYPLNNNGMGGENILTGTGNPLNSYFVGKTATTTSNATGDWGAGSGGNGTFSITVDTTCPVGLYSWNVLNNTSGNRDFQQGNQPYITNQIYTVSFYAKGSGTCLWRVWNNTDSKQMLQRTWTLTSSWTYYSYTFTAVAEMETDLCSFQLGVAGNASISICGMKMEKGSIATPWSPAPFDLGLDTSIVYDISGFKNHGTVTGSLTAAGGGPRYKSCTQFPGNALIEAESLPAETKTISAWIKWATIPNTSGQYSMALHDKNSGLAIGVYNGGSTLISYVGTSSGGTGSQISCSLSTNTWYHIVVIKTGDTTRDVYINGIKATPSGTNWWGGDMNKFHIGSRHISGAYSSYLNGQIVDVRAYATALTADDVAELYALGKV